MHDTAVLIEARVRRFIDERLRPNVHGDLTPAVLASWEVPGEPVPFTEAVGQVYEHFAVGEAVGDDVAEAAGNGTGRTRRRTAVRSRIQRVRAGIPGRGHRLSA